MRLLESLRFAKTSSLFFVALRRPDNVFFPGYQSRL